MKCREARQLFYSWLDGELVKEEARRLQEHVQECPACAGELAEWQSITRALKGLSKQVAPPEGFSAQVMSRLKESLSAREVYSANEGSAGPEVPVRHVHKAAKPAAAGGMPGAEILPAAQTGDFGRKKVHTARIWAPGRWWQGLSGAWRRGVAAAAAVVILLAGSASFAARYWWSPAGMNGSPVVLDNSGQIEQTPGNGSTIVNTDKPGQDVPASLNNGTRETQAPGGQENAPAGPRDRVDKANKESDRSNEPAAPGQAVNGGVQKSRPEQPRQSDNKQGVAIAANTGQSGSNRGGSGGAIEPREFLNQARTIESTLLKVQVADLQAAKKTLLAAAGGSSYQSYGQQRVDGHTVEIMRFVVPVERATSFTATASGLGRVVDRQQQSQDISQQFASALDRYQALIAKRNQMTEEADIAALDREIKSLEQQLAAWDQEAGQQVVVVWLQE
ncbi:anti-sigma factor family protein [Desulfofundulus thermosubterraneus]|uniref:Anti-sigma-W factor RsiW n=1 Tax=Desulfofundulus thermosubterraneus DSM 16057 TaxID=1121432 RepID=A0A1M6HQJ3_9FIRM|nr:zf-HC2 domain-containing protein [Desulfofundulus thermosubterraneus]SHJ24413.1 anti-sigma factor, TIGR02949 family [Desulfofundulus thermosubterraneus DSM 16057]